MATYESGERFGGRLAFLNAARALSVVLGAFLVSTVLFIELSPLWLTIGSVELLPGSLELRTAGGDPLVVFASFSLGLARLYLTGMPALLLAMGVFCSLFGRGRTWTLVVGAACGVLAAGTLPLLSGCHCGAGSTMSLWRSAAWALPDGLGLTAVLGSMNLSVLPAPSGA